MRRLCAGLAFLAACLVLSGVAALAAPVTHERAIAMANAHLARGGNANQAAKSEEILTGADGAPLAYLFALEPTGYVVVAGDDALPPIVAYAWNSVAPADPAGDPLRALLRADLAARLVVAGEAASPHAGWTSPAVATRFTQWPPEGSTPTGGWVTVRWSQGAPYNQSCPRDVAHGGARSAAGCPAVAMGQILDHLHAGGRVRFDDGDDYQHNYAGNLFRFDDDQASYGFPSWPALNTSLAALQARWDDGLPTDAMGAAALVYAAGVAAHQVYSAAGSGTFGVDQTLHAYLRFGFTKCELLPPDSPDLLTRLATNMQAARPAHLAVVTPDWQAGHNVVVDGWNTDGFFHLNFGWGGAYDGWYLLPGGLPYNLTVFEGVIIDIAPPATPVPDGAEMFTLAVAPNPGNPCFTIAYSQPREGRLRTRVFDTRGRLVRALSDEERAAGPGSLAWDGCDDRGRAVGSGVYVLRLEMEEFALTRRLTLVR